MPSGRRIRRRLVSSALSHSSQPQLPRTDVAMNLLGKTLVVFTALASVGLMIMAMLVYSTHTNWKTEADNLSQQLTDKTTELQQESDKYRIMISRLEAEATAALQDVSKLESEREVLTNERQGLQNELEKLQQEEGRTKALVTATEENNKRLQEEVAKLRTQIRDDQQERDEYFAETLRATTGLHSARGELEQVKERNAQLAEQLGMATTRLRENNIDPSGEVVPRVQGLVSATLRDSTGLLIEITVGADDGIKAGHTVEIYRGDKYLGRARILKTDPNRSVARVIRSYQVGPIEEGDDVATKLRVG